MVLLTRTTMPITSASITSRPVLPVCAGQRQHRRTPPSGIGWTAAFEVRVVKVTDATDQRSTMSTLSGPARWFQMGCSRLIGRQCRGRLFQVMAPTAAQPVQKCGAPRGRRRRSSRATVVATNLGQDLGDGGRCGRQRPGYGSRGISQVEESQAEMKFR
jgi:hypothetical protein